MQATNDTAVIQQYGYYRAVQKLSYNIPAQLFGQECITMHK